MNSGEADGDKIETSLAMSWQLLIWEMGHGSHASNTAVNVLVHAWESPHTNPEEELQGSYQF